MPRLLAAIEDVGLRRVVAIVLPAHGLEVTVASNGREVLEVVEREPHDAVLIDLRVATAHQLIAHLASEPRRPLMVLGDDYGEIAASLDAGADDFVTKPFEAEQLLGRLSAALRREPRPVVRTDAFTVDLPARRAMRAGRSLELTRRQWRVLDALVKDEGRLVGLDRLRRAIAAGPDADVRSEIATLRRELEPDPSRPRYLRSESGLGYRFVSGAADRRRQTEEPHER